MQAKRNNINLILALFVSLFLAPLTVSAQEKAAPEGYMYVDSLVYVKIVAVDSAYVGVDVFDMDVIQSEAIAASMRQHIKTNPGRRISGYRVRIFFDNKQTARVESERAISRFESMFPDVSAYRTYANPYFKVTVGDCRNKSEAMILLNRIKKAFPSAFVVKENVRYPVVDKDNAYRVDTVKVLRPIKQQ